MLDLYGGNAIQVGTIFCDIEELDDQLAPRSDASPIEVTQSALRSGLHEHGKRLYILFGMEETGGVNDNAVAEFYQTVEDGIVVRRVTDPPEVGGQLWF